MENKFSDQAMMDPAGGRTARIKAAFIRYAARLPYGALSALMLYPVSCLLAGILAPDVQFFAIALTMLPMVFIYPLLVHAHKMVRAAVIFACCAAVGFGAFHAAPLMFQIVSALFTLLFLVLLDKSGSEPAIVSALSVFILGIDVIVGFLLYRTSFLDGVRHFIDHAVFVSLFAILAFFVLFGVDNARAFSGDILRVPRAMKRHTIIIIAVSTALIVAIGPLMPYMASGFSMLMSAASAVVSAVLSAVAAVIRRLDDLLYALLMNRDDKIAPPDPDADNGLMEMFPEEPVEPVTAPQWLGTALVIILAAIIAFAVLFGLYKALRTLYNYLTKRSRQVGGDEDISFTEIVERIGAEDGGPGKTKRRIRLRPRYPARAPEREKARYIYREYVRRAVRAALTRNCPASTPNAILAEIAENTQDGAFPAPESLAALYNTAAYARGDAELRGADELKKRLL